jgi:hypothetical protein
LNQVEAAAVKEPPAQRQIAPICFEVIAVGVLEVVVVIVLQTDLRFLWPWRSEGYYASQIVSATKEV